jgi:hypothetical protein
MFSMRVQEIYDAVMTELPFLPVLELGGLLDQSYGIGDGLLHHFAFLIFS